MTALCILPYQLPYASCLIFKQLPARLPHFLKLPLFCAMPHSSMTFAGLLSDPTLSTRYPLTLPAIALPAPF
jgi:hypothetical protein